MNIQILTRLNPKTSSWDSGGTNEFTPQDIAAACANCNPFGINILFARVNDNKTAYNKALIKLYLKVIDLSNRERWQFKTEDKGKERLRKMTALALDEVVGSHVCHNCGGTRYSPTVPTQLCRSCRGTGRNVPKHEWYAKVIGVERSTWSGLWDARYRSIITLIQEYQHIAIKEFNNHLK